MKNIDWIAVLHHALTIVGFCIIPLFWVLINTFMLSADQPSVTLTSLVQTWNQHRTSGEPWGALDRDYRP